MQSLLLLSFQCACYCNFDCSMCVFFVYSLQFTHIALAIARVLCLDHLHLISVLCVCVCLFFSCVQCSCCCFIHTNQSTICPFFFVCHLITSFFLNRIFKCFAAFVVENFCTAINFGLYAVQTLHTPTCYKGFWLVFFLLFSIALTHACVRHVLPFGIWQ